MELSESVALVTGASRGIGRSIALRYAREGARVVATARSRDQLASLAEEAPGTIAVEPADVRRHSSVRRVVESASDRFGRIDVLVNNAGVGLLSLRGELKQVHEVEVDEWTTVIETNLTGPFLFAKHALPGMIDRGHGNVINVSSGYGKHGEPGWGPYVSSKHGLEGLTETIALEREEDGVNANTITPAGTTATGFWDTAEKRSYLPPDAREDVHGTDVMDDAMVLLAAQGPDGVSGRSLSAPEWEERLG